MELRRNFVSTLWAIWLHRNEIVFKGGSANPSRLMEIYKDSNSRHTNTTKKWGIDLQTGIPSIHGRIIGKLEPQIT